MYGAVSAIKSLEEDLATWNGQARLQRSVQLRAKAALRQEFGDVQAAREVLTRLRQVLDDIDTNESFLRSTPHNFGTPPSIEGTP